MAMAASTRRVRIFSDPASPGYTKVADAETGEPITDVVSIQFVHMPRSEGHIPPGPHALIDGQMVNATIDVEVDAGVFAMAHCPLCRKDYDVGAETEGVNDGGGGWVHIGE